MIDMNTVTVPEGPIREEIERHGKLFADRLHGTTMYIAGSGFATAVVRSLLTGVSFVVRSANQARFCASVDDTAAHVSKQVGEPKQELRAVLDYILQGGPRTEP
jgi:hypothetical protein